MKLTIGERFAMRQILDDNKSTGLNLSQLRVALDLARKALVDKKELDKANYKFDKKAGRQQWNEVGSEKEIKITNEEKSLFKMFIEQRDKESKFFIDGAALVLSLIDKFNEK